MNEKTFFFVCAFFLFMSVTGREIEDEGRNNERKKLNEVKQKRSNESAVH